MHFGHVGVVVSNLERSIKTYAQAFGFELHARMTRYEPWIGKIVGAKDAVLDFAHLKRPCGLHLELIHYRHPRAHPNTARPWTLGLQHFQLTCEHQGDLLRACNAGFVVLSDEIVTIPEGPNTGARCVYLSGPDGEIVELFQPPQ